MAVSTQDIQLLRSKLGVGIIDAKKALEESNNDVKKAEDSLRAKGLKSAEKRAGRSTNEGVIGEYVHSNGKEAALVAIACETDFVARTDDFKNLAHDIALHIVAAKPKYIKPEDVPESLIAEEEKIWKQQLINEGKPEKMFDNILKGKRNKYFQEICLTKQAFVKDDAVTIEELVRQSITKLGENIQITGFSLLSV